MCIETVCTFKQDTMQWQQVRKSVNAMCICAYVVMREHGEGGT
jgi:hypothetical protein